jgi:hypothetical protein
MTKKKSIQITKVSAATNALSIAELSKCIDEWAKKNGEESRSETMRRLLMCIPKRKAIRAKV